MESHSTFTPQTRRMATAALTNPDASMPEEGGQEASKQCYFCLGNAKGADNLSRAFIHFAVTKIKPIGPRQPYFLLKDSDKNWFIRADMLDCKSMGAKHVFIDKSKRYTDRTDKISVTWTPDANGIYTVKSKLSSPVFTIAGPCDRGASIFIKVNAKKQEVTTTFYDGDDLVQVHSFKEYLALLHST
jgi:hypothetical protein